MPFIPKVEPFFHKDTFTCTFVVIDEATKDCVIIDSVMDLDTMNLQTSHAHNDLVIAYIKKEGLNVKLIMDTHVHADHLTGAQYLKKVFNAPYAIGANICKVQQTFSALYNMKDFKCDGSQFDKLLKDGEVVNAGSISITCWNTPGHTPACMSYLIGDAVFAGDALFTEDFGTGRCDFPGGSAADLYDSVFRLYELPGETRVFVGHDYQPGGRELRVSTTIQLSKDKQEDLPASGKKEDFVKGKSEYDATLNFPRLIFPSLIVNMNAGHLPKEVDGHRYFLIPINLKAPTDDIGCPIGKK